MDVRIYPPEEILEANVQLPLSKSISNRYLIMRALAPVQRPCAQVADCDDTTVLMQALKTGKDSLNTVEINVGLAGTAMRFLTAYFAAMPGSNVVLDGNDRMRKRPLGALVDALLQCGASIQYLGEPGFPPIKIEGKRLHGGTVEMDSSISSQFISALMMVAPTFDSALRLVLKGEMPSLPYIKMTLEMMRRRGIKVEMSGNEVEVTPGHYLDIEDAGIERDWSAASYWYEIAAISAGWVTLSHMHLPSLQGDAAVAEFFKRLGVITDKSEEEADALALNPSPELYSRLDLDLSDNPDLAQTLAVTCCMLGVPFKLTGLQSLRIKETDRLAALQAELAKLSMAVEIEGDSCLAWQLQRIPVQGVAPIATYGDHRMAMAFAPVAIFVPGLKICDAEVVSKSYPEFWDHMRAAGFTIEEE